jgi:hypothetical protein
MTARVGVWLRRYLPAEAASLIGVLIVAQLAWTLSGSGAVAAVAGAWGETLAYYTTMVVREVLRTRAGLLVTLRELVLEFGVAEVLDILLIRPAMMYAGSQLVADVRLGVVLGKLGADVFFYIPTIAAFELRRRQRATAVRSAADVGAGRVAGDFFPAG